MQSPNRANGRKVRSGYRTLIAGQRNREQSEEAKNQNKGATSDGGTRRRPELVECFREHPAILGSLLYFWVTTIGIIYSWTLYRQYDITIFDFAETNDFLLAAFKEPGAFITSLSGLGLVVYVYTIFNSRRSLQSDRLRTILSVSLLTATVAYTVLFPYMSAKRVASFPEAWNQPVQVMYRAASPAGGQTSTTTEGQSSAQQTFERDLALIGSTEKFTFFYDKYYDQALVIPHTQIVHIKVLDNPPADEQ